MTTVSEQTSGPHGDVAVRDAIQSCQSQLADLYAEREAQEQRIAALEEASGSLEAQVAVLLEEHQDLRRAAELRRRDVEAFQARMRALTRKLATRAVALD